MKLIACIMLLGTAGLAGCTMNTPAFTSKERFDQIHRNDVFEAETFNDDIDHFLLLRPSTQLTVWNVYHRD